MTVRIELKPEIEANSAAQAEARGMALDAYLQNAIEDLAHIERQHKGSPEELEAALDLLAEMGKNLAPLPSSALTREASTGITTSELSR
jgi:hypothetical protein